MVVTAIDELVEEIYTLEQTKLNQKFIQIIDEIDDFVKKMEISGYMVDLTKELQSMQDIYLKKDYVQLADFLLYDLKKQFQEAEELVKND